MKNLAILGSTGSIGVNTLDVVRRFPGRFKVLSLACGGNIELLQKQISAFGPRVVSVKDKKSAELLKKRLGKGPVEVLYGVEGMIAAATVPDVDVVISAIVGAAGLVPTMAAIEAGKDIALANKEDRKSVV